MAPYATYRIGAGLLVALGVLHTFFQLTSEAKPLNGTEVTLLELLYNYRTSIMGVMRSKGEIMDGLSLAFGLLSAGLGALGFVTPAERKTALVFAVTLAAVTAISMIYWFIAPTAILATALVCFSVSALLNR